MATRQQVGHRVARAALALCVTMSVLVCSGVGRAAADELEFSGHTRYVVDIAGRAVHVTHDAVVTNNTPDQGNSYFVYTDLPVPVLPEATNMRAREAGGRTLPVTLERDGDFAYAVVDLVPDLRYQETTRFTLTYDLPDLGPRGDGYTRVTPGIATFVAWGFGGPGDATFEVRVPGDLQFDSAGEELVRTVEDGVQVFASGTLDDPVGSWTTVSAADEAQLLERSLSIRDHAIVLRAWPDDPEWATFAETKLTAGVPVLERLVGLAWPVEDALTVSESAGPSVYGYAGWFTESVDEIEIGDAFDGLVLLHEVSHLWFNSTLWSDRWTSEGFAEVFAAAAQRELGEPVDAAPAIADSPRFALVEWPQPLDGVIDENIAADENYGYEQSFAVVQAIADAVGLDALDEVIAKADARVLPYAGDGDTEAMAGAADSRRLLDLLENSGAVGMRDLFARLVFPAADAERLVARDEARLRYDELVVAGDGWSAPYAVRLPMSQWEFGIASGRMDEAAAILATRDDLAARAEPLDLAVPEMLESEYESDPELHDVAAHAGALVDAAGAIAVADAEVDESRNLLEKIGSLGGGAEDDLDDARAAFVAGDAGAAIDAAHDAAALADGAAGAGAQRLAIAGGIVVLAAFGTIVLVGRQRRKHATPAVEEPVAG